MFSSIYDGEDKNDSLTFSWGRNYYYLVPIVIKQSLGREAISARNVKKMFWFFFKFTTVFLPLNTSFS